MKKAFLQTINTFFSVLPILLVILLLINLLNSLLQGHYNQIFSGNYFFDPLIGAVAGSISFGIPLTSYIIGGELLKQGISLLAVTAFIIAWTTVGVLMLPLESSFLGKKFALARNGINFIFSIIIAIVSVIILSLITRNT